MVFLVTDSILRVKRMYESDKCGLVVGDFFLGSFGSNENVCNFEINFGFLGQNRLKIGFSNLNLLHRRVCYIMQDWVFSLAAAPCKGE